MTMQFSKPVLILVGLGYRREIRHALEALQFLNDWPGESREKHAAIAACRAALEARTAADTARLAFIAFCLKHDLLLEQTGILVLGGKAGEGSRRTGAAS